LPGTFRFVNAASSLELEGYIVIRARAAVDAATIAVDADDLLCFVHFAVLSAPAFA